jgi:hypothetical protein
MRPIENPTWLDAGPGRNWQSATRSTKACSSSQRLRTTKFLAKISDMRDRTAETAHAELGKDPQDFGRRIRMPRPLAGAD